MSQGSDIAIEFTEIAPHVSEFRRFVKVFFSRKVVVAGLIVLIILIITAIFAPFLAPYQPNQIDMGQGLLKPSQEHLLGTDSLGRDTLSRLIYGARISLMVGIIAVGIAASVGMTLGLIAGYFGGKTFVVIMRVMDAIMALPMIALALVIASLLGGGLKNVMIAVAIALTPMYARLMCGQVLSVRENDYVVAGHAIGASNVRIMFGHILPNCFPPLIVQMTMMMGTAILTEASLSFLGIGIEPPTAAWGAMVTDGYRYLVSNPVLSFAPGVAIMLVVYGFNMVGDGLRDALDPRLRGTL
jgi:ABC-type dipeptide/oligopeptide/nickel transport system permease subunit